MSSSVEVAYVGGGCFWCTEAVFENVRGVIRVTSGYAGGTTVDPTYEQVCSGTTGHAEVTKIEFDPSAISYETILHVFFASHDPTTLNRQGNDSGTQYRSVVFFTDDEQRRTTEKVTSDLTTQHLFTRPIVTELQPLDKFYLAEEYHQQYYQKHPEAAYCKFVITPKLTKFRAAHRTLLKNL